MTETLGGMLVLTILVLNLLLIEKCKPVISRIVIKTPYTRFLVMPGIVFHELCHYVACLVLFRKVTDVNLYYYHKGKAIGGYVVFNTRRQPYEAFTDMIIGLAPLIGSSILFVALSNYIQIPTIESYEYNVLLWGWDTLNIAVREIHLGVLILLVSISWSAMPSLGDMRVAIKGIIMTTVLAAGAFYVFEDISLAPHLKMIKLFMESIIWITLPSLAIVLVVISTIGSFSSKCFR